MSESQSNDQRTPTNPRLTAIEENAGFLDHRLDEIIEIMEVLTERLDTVEQQIRTLQRRVEATEMASEQAEDNGVIEGESDESGHSSSA